MRRLVLTAALGVAGCGLLSSAVQNSDVQEFVLKSVGAVIREALDDELTNVPFVVEYDHSDKSVGDDGAVRDGEHVWLVTIKDKDLKEAIRRAND